MDWGKIKFFLGEVFRNFTRNAGMQITAIGTVAVTIVILGVFLYVRATLAHLGAQQLDQIVISVYYPANATVAQEGAVRTALAKDDRVLAVQFIPKRLGLRELRARFKGQIDTSMLTENPLPDKLRVRVRSPELVPAVAAHIEKLPGVAYVDYGQRIVTRLLQLADVGRRIGVGVILVFVLVAGIIISNTIRLTVFARRREIGIMQLVGATNMYIRLPFICEGFLDGALGSIVAIGVLALLRVSLLPKLLAALPWLSAGDVVRVDVSSLILELLAVGGAMGIIASWISVGRYLRA
ncbi:MAG TPA: permease-like cell division protein FtsX [Candidatus Baltobacteraceae bacterium]